MLLLGLKVELRAGIFLLFVFVASARGQNLRLTFNYQFSQKWALENQTSMFNYGFRLQDY
jgi:hypothetical protein